MSQQEQIQLFQTQQVRSVWDDETEEWYFSIVDVCSILTDQPIYDKARKYWNKLKQRLVEEGFQPVTNCHQLKMTAKDGKQRLTDVATSEGVFRIIQSIPSKKAEPFKQWMAEAATVEISKSENPKGYQQSAVVAHKGGKIAANTRRQIETQTGKSIISSTKAADYLPPEDRWDTLPDD